MKTIKHTTDCNEIRNVLSLDDMYVKVAYDGSPSLSEFIPEGIWIVLYENGNIAGTINLKQLNNITWMPHIYILERYRGNQSEEWGKLAAEWMKDKCGAKKFLAFTPYKLAKHHAENIGFKQIGILKDSVQKNGVIMDQYILEKS